MNRFQTYHEFDHDGKHYRLVYDYDHQTRGSYAYSSEEETRAAEEEEIENLKLGKWVVLGCIVTAKCRDKTHCEACAGVADVDSLWGIVIEDSHEAVENFVKEAM